MFGFGKKESKDKLLQAYATEAAANIVLEDLRTLQRAVDLIAGYQDVARIMAAFIDKYDVADNLPDEDVDVGGKTYHVSAEEAARTEALNALHQLFCKRLAEVLPENAKPNEVGLLVSRMLGMPFVEEMDAAH